MLNIYPPSSFDIYRKVQIHYSSAIDAACDEIYKATQGVGTDEKVLVRVLGPRSPNDRGLIVHRYKELYNTSLRDVVKSETSGDFNYLLQLTCLNLPQAEAFIVYHAMHGVGTSENLIYPVLMGRTNDEINLLKKAFYEMYGTDLAVMLNDDLSGDFKAIMALAANEPVVEYKQSYHTQSKVEEDADLIYKAGEGKWGTDEGSFIKTILSAPPQHLVHIEQAYKAKHGHGLVKAIENEFSGTSTQALVFHVRLTLDPWNTLADYIDDAMKGIGTDESALSAAIVRYHPYLNRIKHAYEEKHKTQLRDRVQSEVSGSYQELLLHIIDAPRSVGNYA